MVKRIGDKKIGKVKAPEKSVGTEQSSAIGRVGSVARTQAVQSTGAAGGVKRRGPTREISAEERAELMRIVGEEAEKIFGSSKQRKLVEGAVRMTIDAALGEEPKK